MTVAMPTEDGYLSVLTGMDHAKIFINGTYLADKTLRKYRLHEGDYDLRIEVNDQLMYARTVRVYQGQLQTITSGNLVSRSLTTKEKTGMGGVHVCR